MRFVVQTSPRFDRLLKKHAKHHPDLQGLFAAAVAVLGADPFNRSRSHAIKKLQGIPQGEGQFRLRLGRWRFRYDISGQVVELHYCGLRREDTYN